uniref:EF-hand family protein n=1 Tax=Coptotermes formosanus TaxID=36987 RepID=R4UJV4_COPFO|nr:EF-hand family protein [Coptotermes formosanus]
MGIMDEDYVVVYSRKFDEKDKDNSKTIDRDEFLFLYRDIEGDDTKTQTEADIIFNGIDIDNSNTLSKDEFLDLVKSIKGGDKQYLHKMVFRSFDKDRSKTLEAEEIVAYSEFCKKAKTKEEAEELVKKYNPDGKGKGLTFPQLYEELTGVKIDPKTDPYDGKLGKCCLIL